MTKKILKYFFFMITTAAIIICIWVSLNLKHIKAFPLMVSAYYSKEFCSCYFISDGTDEDCHRLIRQWIPIQNFSLDLNTRTVTVTGLYHTSRARYIDDRAGCIIENLE